MKKKKILQNDNFKAPSRIYLAFCFYLQSLWGKLRVAIMLMLCAGTF